MYLRSGQVSRPDPGVAVTLGSEVGWTPGVVGSESARDLGLGEYLGQIRRGTDGNLYEWSRGIDGLGNPVGFWSLLPNWAKRLPIPPPPVAPSPVASEICFPSAICLPLAVGKPEARGEEYWDPHGSGNPLLDTGEARRSLKLAPHFTVAELASSGSTRFPVARIDPKLVECLEKIRVAVGRPVRVVSGYRSWGYNKRLYEKWGKEPTLSQHCSGRAADIRISGMTGYEIAEVAIRECGCALGIGLGMGSDGNGVHIDTRGVWAHWDYGGAKARGYKRRIIRFHSTHC